MIEKQTKMGRRSSKFHAHKKILSSEKSLFSVPHEFFSTDKSDDSGLGSDASFLFGDSSLTACADFESDLDDSFDSSHSSISSSAAVPTSNYRRGGGRLQIDTNLAISLNDKMRIHAVDQTDRDTDKLRIASVLSLAEPLAKRRKMTASNQGCCAGDFSSYDRHLSSASRENGLQKFARTQQPCGNRPLHVVGGRVLTEAAVCHNALSKRNESAADDGRHDHRLPWSTRENFGHSLLGGDGSGDRIASLLVAATQPSVGLAGRKKLLRKPSLHVCFPPRSKELKAELTILVQPEEQHRARYMTEGSRGSIKDDRGNGFPKIKLCGYRQPVVLQVFIGSDTGKIQPHLFYQACKVTGKNCTPCAERMIEGTSVIEINVLPENDMTVSCDCIGILKERNVDVEQRLPYFGLARCKKRSTKCRMVFRVNIPLPNGNIETLQITSSQILCTQSPGLPEICKKSLVECSAKGGTELFIIGKNFQKDVRIVFQELREGDDERRLVWEETVEPEKEFLHQTHLICSVPPYRDGGIMFPVKVYLSVLSGGKSSEPHTFTYTPYHSVSNGNRYFGCNADYPLQTSHSSLDFCKNERLSLTSPVPHESPLMHSSILSSQMLANSCPASPVNAVPASLAIHLISPSKSQEPTSPSSTSSNPQLPMSLIDSVIEHDRMQCGGLNDCRQSNPPMNSPISSSAPLPPPHHVANDLVGHDVDLMKKIDQLASEMSGAVDAQCSVSEQSERHLGLSTLPESPVDTRGTVIDDVHDSGPMLSMCHNIDDTIRCHSSADPPVSLASIVSAMVTSATTSSVQRLNHQQMFVMNQESEKPSMQMDDQHRDVVSAMSAISGALRLDHGAGDILEIKSSVYPELDRLEACPQQLPSILAVETDAAAPATHEASMSYDVHCCSGIIISSGASSTSMISPASSVSVNPNDETVAHPFPTNVQDAKSEAALTGPSSDRLKTGKPGAQPDMMTLHFSQLSDADLLSMINPSTFDSV